MKNEVHVSFNIWEFEDMSHKEISEFLGVNFSKIFIKGEKQNPNFNQLSKSNAWFLVSPLGIYANFDEQLNALLGLMQPNINSFKTICEKYSCEISVAVYIYIDNGESKPSLYLTIDQIAKLNELKLEIDFDLYCLPNTQ